MKAHYEMQAPLFVHADARGSTIVKLEINGAASAASLEAPNN
jgi:hypothetical protein